MCFFRNVLLPLAGLKNKSMFTLMKTIISTFSEMSLFLYSSMFCAAWAELLWTILIKLSLCVVCCFFFYSLMRLIVLNTALSLPPLKLPMQFTIAMLNWSTVKYLHTADMFLCASCSNWFCILLRFTAINCDLCIKCRGETSSMILVCNN